MTRLKTNLYYLKKCGYCDNIERFILRAKNVNVDITDDDARRVAVNSVGNTEGGHCENCKKYTLHTIVAYELYGHPTQTKEEQI